jgi:hypothetical protein
VMGHEAQIRGRLIRRLAILGLLAIFGACVHWVALPVWWRSQMNALLAEWRKDRSSIVQREIVDLLSRHSYGDEGNRILSEIISPRLNVRSNYLAGRRVFVSLEAACDLNPRELLVQHSTVVLLGDQVLERWETQSALKRGTIANLQFTNGMRSDGRVVSLTETGDYGALVLFRIKLLPEPGMKWVWPGSRPLPWKLLPERVARKTGSPLSIAPAYECEFPFQVNIKIRPPGAVDPVQILYNPELDSRVREAFRVRADVSKIRARTSRGQRRVAEIPFRGGISIAYEDLPANVAFRMSFREANGIEHSGTPFGSLRCAGHSGVITAFEIYYNVLQSLVPGAYTGELIFITDVDAAYEWPGIDTLWSGTLSFPVSFSIDSSEEH